MATATEMLMALLERGANPKVTDEQGNTLMHTTDSPELIDALLSRDLDPNAANKVRTKQRSLAIALFLRC